jgi:hypothetical protein
VEDRFMEIGRPAPERVPSLAAGIAIRAFVLHRIDTEQPGLSVHRNNDSEREELAQLL